MNKISIKIIGSILTIAVSVSFAMSVSDYIDKSKCDQLIVNDYFSVCYDYSYKGAISGWTRLSGNLVNKVNIKKRSKFHSNLSIPEKYRTNYKDYTGTGKKWNRGHTIISDASSDYSADSLYASYSMQNITPESALVNQKTWIKVERYGRLIATKLGEVESVTLVRYSSHPKYIKNKIAIPSGYYRILFNNSKGFEKCFYYENILNVDVKNDKLKDHLVGCNTLK